jgi:hypothetical protein
MRMTGRKFGTLVHDDTGRVVEVSGKVRLGEQVLWLGRKHGSCTHDAKFEINQAYQVYFIYPSNGDVELQGPEPHITIRATGDEYRRLKGIVESKQERPD